MGMVVVGDGEEGERLMCCLCIVWKRSIGMQPVLGYAHFLSGSGSWLMDMRCLGWAIY